MREGVSVRVRVRGAVIGDARGWGGGGGVGEGGGGVVPY